MFPLGKIIGTGFAALGVRSYTAAAPAVGVAPQNAELDATANPVAATLAAPGADMVGKPVVFRVTNADNAVTLALTTVEGSSTLTLALGDIFVVYGATATQWAFLTFPASLLGLSTTGGVALSSATPSTFVQTYATADLTHSARTAAGLTDSSGGTPGATLAAITGGGAGCENATKNAIASLNAEIDKLRADHTDSAQLLNALIDSLQAQGLAA
jgi:hypothetical protein